MILLGNLSRRIAPLMWKETSPGTWESKCDITQMSYDISLCSTRYIMSVDYDALGVNTVFGKEELTLDDVKAQAETCRIRFIDAAADAIRIVKERYPSAVV